MTSHTPLFITSMKKLIHITLVLTMIVTASCQQDFTTKPDTSDNPLTGIYVPDKAVIHISETLAQTIESADDAGKTILGSAARRTFPHGGRYEERMRKAGLHLWYDVEFDGSAPLTKAGNALLDIEGVESVEYLPKISVAAGTVPFDDPDLKKQWHYTNTGNVVTGLTPGCDINVAPAWERGITGSDKVIVAVLDGGVDLNHEDLKDNLWQGTDEDGKTIHGYNFVSDTYFINPDEHGTHVAGTIAAVNNNGTGVSGIAGGNAALGQKGVRIMSCEILSGDKSGNEANAMVWAANHGAVIAQNSWGYLQEVNEELTEIPGYIKAAIDYFNEFAGCDESGAQLPDSPMKGGVVIFAAGNESSSIGYPAAYEGCIAVSALAGDFKPAYYTNYGDWIDITAPGGDAKKRQYVYSTVPENAYGSLQGTSMACPHVSGTAALILSEFGGQGFTREDLIERLLKTATDVSLPARQMGAGMVNASAAVAHYGEFLPHAPESAKQEVLSGSSVILKYIMPEDNNGVECRQVDLLYDTETFTEESGTLARLRQPVSQKHAGDTIAFTVEGLTMNTTYHFSVVAYDAFGYSSPLTENIAITTRDNLAPTIEAMDGTEHTVMQYKRTKLRFRITDPEDGLKDVVYENATEHDSFTKDGDYHVITIDAHAIPGGSYTSRLTATDDAGKTTQCEVTFTIVENRAPVLHAGFDNILFTAISGSRKITLPEHLSDEDGETLTYTAESSSTAVVKASVSGDALTLNSTGYGEAVVTVTASDSFSKTVTASFRVTVRDGSKPLDIYPVPATDVINIRTATEQEYDIHIFNATGREVISRKSLIGIYNVLTLDITSLSPGNYSVRLEGADGKVILSDFVKL